MSTLAFSTAIMSLGTVLSRVTGLFRLAAVASALGITESGHLADAYNLANTAPNIIYELVLGGILTSVFVPLFVELLEKEDRDRAWEVATGLINVSLAVLSGITLLGIAVAPWIAKIYSSRLHGHEALLQQQVITFLLRLFIPQIFFYGLYFLIAGLLNAHRRFGPPMFTPILNNVVVIAVFVWFHHLYGHVTLSSVTTPQLWLMGLGTTAGVAAAGVTLVPYMRGLGRYRLNFSVNHPSVKKLARLSIFVLGYVVVNQIGFLIVQYLANGQPGGYSAYVNAFTFFMLPHGLFAVSVITALLPGMSEHAVHAQWDQFRDRLSTGIRATLLLILPASIGYLVLGEPIVRILLQHGVMTTRSTELVATVLRFFVLGLVPFSVFQLLSRAFYAMQDTKTPFLINCFSVGTNIVIDFPLFFALGVKGLALGQSISYFIGVVLQLHQLRKRIGGIDGTRLLASGLRITGAAVLMGALVWLTFQGLVRITTTSAIGDLAQVALPIAVGVASYLIFANLLKVEEIGYVRSLLARRLHRAT
ncbi:MAG: putative peptidoglycan lipid flippase [Actinomycetota bacterium]|nr:putative peptidoglycan lipid flippase [Actinomycetota bacterium]